MDALTREPCQAVGGAVHELKVRLSGAVPERRELLEKESGDPRREAEQREPLRAPYLGPMGLKGPQHQEEIRHEHDCKRKN